jgi:hypothetical protein
MKITKSRLEMYVKRPRINGKRMPALIGPYLDPPWHWWPQLPYCDMDLEGHIPLPW